MSARYVLIAPCRDEAATMRATLDSIARQTIAPDQLIVVDDGSTDGSGAILADYAARLPFLRIVTRVDRGERRLGTGVVDAFYDGLAVADLDGIAFLGKVDMDIDLPPGYFAELIARMDADATIATASGKAFFRDAGSGRLVPELNADTFSVGMTKFYRLSAWRAIGGFARSIGWDGIDCHLCRMHGFKAVSIDDPALRFVHLRPMGSSHLNLWEGRKRHGLGAWVMGVPPVFMMATAIYRLAKRPYVVGAFGVAWGYLRAWWSGVPRFAAPGYQRFVRRYHRLALLIGRNRAAERLRRAAAGETRGA